MPGDKLDRIPAFACLLIIIPARLILERNLLRQNYYFNICIKPVPADKGVVSHSARVLAVMPNKKTKT
jgi:hypothetical protein